MRKKVVLAYSGGLDTSVILKWLSKKSYEVIAYIADVGQQDDFKKVREKALAIGASKVYIAKLQRELLTDYIFPIIRANAVYENRYLLGTAVARPLIAKRQIEIARQEGAEYVAHGATGKGNDQVRFELAYYALNPEIKVIAPWKDGEFLRQFRGRTDLLNYAKQEGIPVTASTAHPYSEDENILHISHEAGILEDPNKICPDEVYSRVSAPKEAPDKISRIKLEFLDGNPVKLINTEQQLAISDPLELFTYLNQLGAENAVGRLDMVENRFVGIKSRGVYETPGGTILHNAHLDLEGIAMDREVMRLRDTLAVKMAELVYNGLWFSPEMDFIMGAIDKSQEAIDGTVTLEIYKGNAYPIARTSPSSLYNPQTSSMDIEGGYNQMDAEGFIKINAVRLMAHQRIMHNRRS